MASEINDETNVKEIFDLYSYSHVLKSDDVCANIIPSPFPGSRELGTNECCFYRVNKISYDEEYPRREAFENVLLSLDDDAFNFVYILNGTQKGIELYVGAVRNANENKPVLGTKMTAVRYGENIAEAFKGNFNGSELEPVKGERLKDLVINSPTMYKYAGIITGIPSIDEEAAGQGHDFQGIDRLINSMLGQEWRLVIVCEPVTKEQTTELRDEVYSLYNRLSAWAKFNVQNSLNKGSATTSGTNDSHSTSTNSGENLSNTDTQGRSSSSGGSSSSRGKNSSNATTTGHSKGTSDSRSHGTSKSTSKNEGFSQAVSVERANKCVQEMMKYIDDELLQRIKTAYSKCLYKSSVYYMAKEPVVANRLKVGIISLFQGNNPSYSPLQASLIDLNDANSYRILNTYQNNNTFMPSTSSDKYVLLGRPYDVTQQLLGLNTYLTPREISLLAGMPQKEVPGLVLKRAVNFGLNEKADLEDDAVDLGVLVQQGRKLDNMRFKLSRKSLNKHTFIAGVTGSGKTTTCQKLLAGANVPFMVIEPAKTEYRALIHNPRFGKELLVFTLGNEQLAPFRLNPFELVEGELITSHVDMLKATFTSSFPMEASMPQLLEESMYKCYEVMGWNVETNTNELFADPFAPGVHSFPQLSDLLAAMETVVDTKGFGDRLAGDYKGSLVSRLSNLTVGSKGMMLDCPRSVDFEYLATHNVVLELEYVRSPEEKSLIMGFILSRMSEVIKKLHRTQTGYRHITLVEEAHRLLSKVEFDDSGAKKVAVETFTDLLAEVRKYGEGLIIVDQIPNKLASDVLKNTNTKIIHRILARDDKEAVGDTMLMNDKQKEYLSSLDIGHAIVFTENTDNPVNIYVERISDTDDADIPESDVKERFGQIKEKLGDCYGSSNLSVLLKYLNHAGRALNGKIGTIGNRETDIKRTLNVLKTHLNTYAAQHEMDVQELLQNLLLLRDIKNGQRFKRMDLGQFEIRQEQVGKLFHYVLYIEGPLTGDVLEEFLREQGEAASTIRAGNTLTV